MVTNTPALPRWRRAAQRVRPALAALLALALSRVAAAPTTASAACAVASAAGPAPRFFLTATGGVRAEGIALLADAAVAPDSSVIYSAGAWAPASVRAGSALMAPAVETAATPATETLPVTACGAGLRLASASAPRFFFVGSQLFAAGYFAAPAASAIHSAHWPTSGTGR